MALVLALLPGLTYAAPAPPSLMTYQGYLVDGDGNALGADTPKNYDVIFRIWSHQTSTDAGDKKWSEQQTVTVDKGYFSVLLGQGNSVAGEQTLHDTGLSEIYTNDYASELYMGITVKGIGKDDVDVDLAPRLRLVTAPYAFLSSHAKEADYAAKAGTVVNAAQDEVLYVKETKVGINKSQPDTALDVEGTVTATTFVGAMDAGNLTTGTLADARLSGNVALRDSNNTFTGNVNRFEDSSGILIGRSANGSTVLGLSVSQPTSGQAVVQGIKAQGSAWGDILLNPNGGNVGVGIKSTDPAPATALDVNGTTTTSNLIVKSNLKLGSNQQLDAVGGSAALRIVRGIINPNGSRYIGEGFTSSRTLTGVYVINFDAPFKDSPAVTATPIIGDDGNPRQRIAQWQGLTPSKVGIVIQNSGTGEAVDLTFSFIAIGER